MTNPYPATGATSQRTSPAESSVGELISQVTTDMTTLMRQEFALAKAEITEEAKKAGKGAGLLGGAGFAGYFLLLFASLTLMFVLDEFLPIWAAAGIVALLYAIAAAVAFTKGKAELKTVDPTPHQTIETLKEGMPR